jgi:predicted nicotinamide N-methyase
MREESFEVGGHTLTITRPESAESLIDESRFDLDEFLPYWAEPWPSGLALARYLATLDLAGRRVLELGCGLALPSLTAARRGAEVLATDWAPEALELVTENATVNGVRVETALLDWGTGAPAGLPRFELVVAADVLYEERNAAPLLRVLQATVAEEGTAVVADPGRRHATAFFDGAESAGWVLEAVQATEIPAGGVVVMHRSGAGTGTTGRSRSPSVAVGPTRCG